MDGVKKKTPILLRYNTFVSTVLGFVIPWYIYDSDPWPVFSLPFSVKKDKKTQFRTFFM